METLSLFQLSSAARDAVEPTKSVVSPFFGPVIESFQSEFPKDQTLTASAAPRDSIPLEHTLSCDAKWSYPGGNFGQRLSSNFLEDPRIRHLPLKALGLYVMLRASWEAGRAIPSKTKLAARSFGISPVAWTNALNELLLCEPSPLVEIRQGFVLPKSFGKPIASGLSEIRSLAAHARHEKVKQQAGIARQEEPQIPEPEEAEEDLSIPLPSPGLFDDQGLTQPPSPQICPYNELVKLFNAHCPSLKPITVTTWPVSRKKALQSAWRSHPSLEFWTNLFETVEQSDWLCGRSKRGSNSSPWVATFDWIIAPRNTFKITEGNFSQNKSSMFAGNQFTAGGYGDHELDSTAAWLK